MAENIQSVIAQTAQNLKNKHEGLFNTVYRDEFNQPPEDPNRAPMLIGKFSEIATISAKQFQDSFGRAPNAEELTNLVDRGVDREFAKDVILGEESSSQFVARTVIPQIESISTKEKAIKEGPLVAEEQKRFEEEARGFGREREAALSEAARLEGESAAGKLAEQFGGARRRLIEELAGIGQLDQPSATTAKVELEKEFQKGLGDLIKQLAARRLGISSDVLGETLGKIERGREFGAELGLRKEGLGLQKEELGLRRGGMLEEIRERARSFREQRRQFQEQQTLAK